MGDRGGRGGREYISGVRSPFDSTYCNPGLKNLDDQVPRARVREPRVLQHVLDDVLQTGTFHETIHSSSRGDVATTYADTIVPYFHITKRSLLSLFTITYRGSRTGIPRLSSLIGP